MPWVWGQSVVGAHEGCLPLVVRIDQAQRHGGALCNKDKVLGGEPRVGGAGHGLSARPPAARLAWMRCRFATSEGET
jgi:hypothetical protein